MIDRFANGDVTKYDEIAEREYLECLNIMGYWHQRDKKIEDDNRKNK